MTFSKTISTGLPEATRRLATAWFAFAVAALGVSTLFALLLIASRTPGVGALLPGHNFFYKALVLHVDLSVIVWALAAGSALLALATPSRAVWVGWLALLLGVAGSISMALGPLPSEVEVLKSNYVPVLRSWPFLIGLVMFGSAAALMALRTVVLLRPLQAEAEERPALLAAYGAAVGVLLAAVAAGWGYVLIPEGSLQPAAYFELLSWAPGHILQLANMLFMLMAWLWLASAWGLAGTAHRLWSRVVLFLGLLPLLAVPVLLFAYPPASAEFKIGFTELMRWGSWLAAVPLGLSLLLRLRRDTKMPTGFRTGLQFSILLFFFGIAIGTLINADNVMVPAHYHGTVGAMTLALMTVCLQQLSRLGFSPGRVAQPRWQLWLYGGGTLMMALGLAASGWMGVARKLPGDVQMLANTGSLVNPGSLGAGMMAGAGRTIAMSFAGLGGAVAVTGSVLFVIGVLIALGGRAKQGAEEAGKVLPARTTSRWLFAGLLIVGLTVALGSLFAVLRGAEPKPPASAQIPAHTDPEGHMAAAEKQEIDLRFQQAVTMLHAKQYEYAAAAIERILKIRPDMPEAHVNMGYALLGLKQYQAAYGHFNKATELRPMQANAYYGMAEALHELGEVEGALGAMRSYIHLSSADDPYLRSARAALWEWEEEIKKRKSAAASKKVKPKKDKPVQSPVEGSASPVPVSPVPDSPATPNSL